MTPRNEFDGSERPSEAELIVKVAQFVDTMPAPEDGKEVIFQGITPPADDTARAFREGLLVELEARQESNPMVTRAAVIDNIKKSLER